MKEYKDRIEYHAAKDFNWRILSNSRIHGYLNGLYNERDRILNAVPNNIRRQNIKESLAYLQKLKDA